VSSAQYRILSPAGSSREDGRADVQTGDGSLVLAPEGQSVLRIPFGQIASVTEPAPYTILLRLADGSGIELLGHIKITWPCAGVVMISNQVNPTYKVLCHEKGADYVIDKSNDYEMIPNLIATFSGCSGSTTQSLSH